MMNIARCATEGQRYALELKIDPGKARWGFQKVFALILPLGDRENLRRIQAEVCILWGLCFAAGGWIRQEKLVFALVHHDIAQRVFLLNEVGKVLRREKHRTATGSGFG